MKCASYVAFMLKCRRIFGVASELIQIVLAGLARIRSDCRKASRRSASGGDASFSIDDLGKSGRETLSRAAASETPISPKGNSGILPGCAGFFMSIRLILKFNPRLENKMWGTRRFNE